MEPNCDIHESSEKRDEFRNQDLMPEEDFQHRTILQE